MSTTLTRQNYNPDIFDAPVRIVSLAKLEDLYLVSLQSVTNADAVVTAYIWGAPAKVLERQFKPGDVIVAEARSNPSGDAVIAAFARVSK